MAQATGEDALRRLDPFIGEWTLAAFSPEGEPFPQRFTATISSDGGSIAGRWEKADEGIDFAPDFDLVYRKVRRGS
jgi:hypothetical protein